MQTRKPIIIGGGVGPAAGVLLHRMIIENTLTDGSDQSHLDVIHISRSSTIPDRTEYLRGRIAENPALGMARCFDMAAKALGSKNVEAVGGVPCNTFHAPAIFGVFRELVAATAPGIKIIDMLEETVASIRLASPGIAQVGVLSTTGTRMAGIYDAPFARAGMRTIYVPESRQEELHRCIYDRDWGLKAVSPATAQACDLVRDLAGILVEAGARIIVLGCTELPLALPGDLFHSDSRSGPVRLVDPMLALARALVREADPSALLPFTDRFQRAPEPISKAGYF
jgi:aspartate racemase